MGVIRLQPKQARALELLEGSPASWIGIGGGRGARSEAKEALSTGAELEVMHATDSDHRWYLDEQTRKPPQADSTGEV